MQLNLNFGNFFKNNKGNSSKQTGILMNKNDKKTLQNIYNQKSSSNFQNAMEHKY